MEDERDSPGGARPEPAPLAELTERERQVLSLLAVGRSNQEIADELAISLGTVGSHTKRIYRKLEVNNRTEAAARFFTSRWSD